MGRNWLSRLAGCVAVVLFFGAAYAAQDENSVIEHGSYKVRFAANGGVGKMAVQTIASNKAVALRKNAFRRKRCVFIGWARKRNGAVAYLNGAKVTNVAARGKSATLYAKWAKEKYKVAFVANGGKGTMAAQTMTYGKSARLRANKFTRKGYAFKGWAKSKNGKVVYKNKKKVKNLVKNGKTVKLYAKWAKKPSANYCTITFNANGGNGRMAKQKVKMGTTAKVRKNTFTRPGYVFLGWSLSRDGHDGIAKDQSKFIAYPDGKKATTIYAQWQKK